MPSEIHWFKITTDMFDDEKILIIEAMPDRDALLIIWVKLLAQAAKTNDSGYIYLTETIPYTVEMLATVFRRPVATVRLAIATLVQLQMIEMDEKGKIFVINWAKHQNIEGMERVRQLDRERHRKFRSKQHQLLLGNVTSRDSHAIDSDSDSDLEREKEREQDIKENTTLWNNILTVVKSEVTAVNFVTYFERTKLVELRSDVMIIAVPSTCCAEYLSNNQESLLHRVVVGTVGHDMEVRVIAMPELWAV
jgi:predicted phage replisome organizer